MVVVPFGILKHRNGNFHFQSQQISAQKQAQPPEQKPEINSVEDIVKNHPELSIEGDKIVVRRFIEPKKVFHEVRDELVKGGWKYVKPKQIGGAKWKPEYFELKEEAKA